jgi:2-dehydro-3-deoxygluconokinase
MKKFITFGEIMLRLSPPNQLRFGQTRTLDVAYGGGESNVAVSLSNYGFETEFVTRLPQNDLGESCLQYLRQYGVGTHFIERGGNRLGIYFLENGVVMRGSQVIYDRADSSFATISTNTFDWKQIFRDASWFHWTGITPAVSAGAAAVCLEAIMTASDMGVTISCDLNYRAKLWKWGKTASEIMEEMVSYCDVAIGNEEDAEKVFGIHAPETNITLGEVTAEKYQFVCESLVKKFGKLKTIAITLRSSLSASHNTWSAILWHSGEIYRGPIYDITHIVDRVGSGDSFMGSLIYGLMTCSSDPQRALDFATAASALKHTIFGDFNLVSVTEVEKLMHGDGSGRVNR